MTATANPTALDALIAAAPARRRIFFASGTTYFNTIRLPTAKVINLRGADMARLVVRRRAGVTGDFITVRTNYTYPEDFTIEGGHYQSIGTPRMDNLVINASYFHLQRLGIN